MSEFTGTSNLPVANPFLMRQSFSACQRPLASVYGALGLRRSRSTWSAAEVEQDPLQSAWIPARSATRLREADLHILSKFGKQGLERRLEPEAFAGREVGREDDLLDVLVGCAVDIEVARQPSA